MSKIREMIKVLSKRIINLISMRYTKKRQDQKNTKQNPDKMRDQY